MRCDHCGATDSVFYIRPDGQGGEERLCRACALKKGYATEGDGYGARLDVLAGERSSDAVSACPACAWTGERLRSTGLLGCPECAGVFRRAVDLALRRSGGGVRYEGKVPPRDRRPSDARGQEAAQAKAPEPGSPGELAEALERAIAAEDFEAAAVYRDRIRAAAREERA